MYDLPNYDSSGDRGRGGRGLGRRAREVREAGRLNAPKAEGPLPNGQNEKYARKKNAKCESKHICKVSGWTCNAGSPCLSVDTLPY